LIQRRDRERSLAPPPQQVEAVRPIARHPRKLNLMADAGFERRKSVRKNAAQVARATPRDRNARAANVLIRSNVSRAFPVIVGHR